MRTKLIVCIGVVVLCSAGHAVTLTFDEVPSGTVLSYTYHDRIQFARFQAADHTASLWGPPRSGSNVLAVTNTSYNPWIGFGYFPGGGFHPDPVQSVFGYFSTQTGAMVRITAYAYEHGNPNPIPVTGVIIGTADGAWENVPVEISTAPDHPFFELDFEPVNSPDDLLGFCADDMTITLVPEPSSLLALAGALMGLGGLALRRRRR